MPIGFPSLRVDHANPLHHVWCNNGTWWIHYTLHFDGRKRRIRRSLGTAVLDIALERRDELLNRIAREGEPVPQRRPRAVIDPPPASSQGIRSVSLAP